MVNRSLLVSLAISVDSLIPRVRCSPIFVVLRLLAESAGDGEIFMVAIPVAKCG